MAELADAPCDASATFSQAPCIDNQIEMPGAKGVAYFDADEEFQVRVLASPLMGMWCNGNTL
jgi:hypothetical protein